MPEAGAGRTAGIPRPVGVVRAVDPVEGFVIADFGVNRVPASGTEMRARRGDRIVGTIRIVEPSAASLAAADILSGALEAGDLIE